MVKSIVDKFKNFKIEEKGRVFGSPLVGVTYKGKFTLEDVRRQVKSFNNIIARKGGENMFSVNILLPKVDKETKEVLGDGRWFNVLPFTPARRDNRIRFNIDDYENGITDDYFDKLKVIVPDKIKSFMILFTKDTGNKKVGNSEHNDCLYDCLKAAIPLFRYIYKTPKEFKKSLGLKRNDKVPISLIPKIEDELKNYRINIYGDCQYYSKKDILDSPYEVNLCSTKEHVYSLKKNSSSRMDCYKGISYEERRPLFFKLSTNNPESIVVYDGKKTYEESYKKYLKKRAKPLSSDVLYIKCNPDVDMEKEYNEFKKDADFIKKVSNGNYNLYKSGKDIKCVLQRFQRLNKNLVADSIEGDEAIWIDKASYSALIWAENGYEGPGYEYDFVSKYASILIDQRFMFPIKKGIFKSLSKEDFNHLDSYDFGIYNVKIFANDDKLFRCNKHHLYTHYDLTRAKELGLQMEIIETGMPNVLLYPEGKVIRSKICFGKIINELFALKREYANNCKRIKTFTTCLWGALSEKMKKMITVKANGSFNYKGENEALQLHKVLDIGKDPFNPSHRIFYFTYPCPIYNSNLARMAPFILAKARSDLSRIVEAHYGNIVRVHTDGFISKNKLEINTGENLGDLKYKGYCNNLLIKNAITIIDTETKDKYTKSLID